MPCMIRFSRQAKRLTDSTFPGMVICNGVTDKRGQTFHPPLVGSSAAVLFMYRLLCWMSACAARVRPRKPETVDGNKQMTCTRALR
ncbi:hypothetical protein CEXT_488281 [Caerostris extrusa]|uniref:Uncharacterized protein n=1 Tax=Caerostris extrusa TaxID=172846 RepID=A0AAV4XFR1_CAEEX|nr:hypothetical protein CEXT_488281 [Caerostris extrusa]